MSKKPTIINISGSTPNVDPFFRYKMEEAILTNQGVTMVFENIDSICGSLDRDPHLMVKFLRKHFGAKTDYKKNTAIIMKRNLLKSDLQDAVHKFIDTFVLCPKCNNPETTFSEDKAKFKLQCKACNNLHVIVK